MQIRTTIKPGQDGTKRYQKKRNEQSNKRIAIAKLIVEEHGEGPDPIRSLGPNKAAIVPRYALFCQRAWAFV